MAKTGANTKIEIRPSPISGKGLFAAAPFRKGETVLTWHPTVLTKAEAGKLPPDEQQHYLYPDGDKLLWMQSPERYVNHSCNANTHVDGKSDVASRDIQAGEEITSDYLDVGREDSVCNCGAENCRRPRRVRSD